MRSSVCFLQSSNAASDYLLWAFPTLSCGSGYILWFVRFVPLPPKLIKRSLAPKKCWSKQPASLRPKGSLSLTLRGVPPLPLATQGTAYSATPCKTKKLLPDFLSGRSNIIQVMSFTAMRHFPLPSFRWGNLPRSSRETRSYSSLFPCEVSGAPSSGRCGCSRR